MSSHLQVLETWFRKVWNEGDASAIDQMFAKDGKARGLGGEDLVTEVADLQAVEEQVRIGPEGFKIFHERLFSMLEDFDIQVNQSMEDGDWISALCTVNATSRETGERVKMTGSVLARMADGKLAEAYNHWDFMSFYQQLGLLPENAFERCLCGERLA